MLVHSLVAVPELAAGAEAKQPAASDDLARSRRALMYEVASVRALASEDRNLKMLFICSGLSKVSALSNIKEATGSFLPPNRFCSAVAVSALSQGAALSFSPSQRLLAPADEGAGDTRPLGLAFRWTPVEA